MDQPVETVKDLFVMSDCYDAGLLFHRQLAQKVHHQLRALAVERGGRFVGKNDPGAIGQRPRDGDALRLPARKKRGLHRGAVADLEIVEQLARPGATLGGRFAGKVENDRDILLRRQEGQKVMRLKDETDLFEPKPPEIAAKPFAVEDRFPVQRDPTGGRGKDAADDVQQRRLARPGRA